MACEMEESEYDEFASSFNSIDRSCVTKGERERSFICMYHVEIESFGETMIRKAKFDCIFHRSLSASTLVFIFLPEVDRCVVYLSAKEFPWNSRPAKSIGDKSKTL
jgi:hypothetical protein